MRFIYLSSCRYRQDIMSCPTNMYAILDDNSPQKDKSLISLFEAKGETCYQRTIIVERVSWVYTGLKTFLSGALSQYGRSCISTWLPTHDLNMNVLIISKPNQSNIVLWISVLELCKCGKGNVPNTMLSITAAQRE